MVFLGILTLLLNFASYCLAQSTNATCLPAYKWAFNSKNQSPCLVAAYLESACSPSPFRVPALPDPQANQYQGPSFAAANPCQCNTVVYSLLSACGACQGHPWEDWRNWSINCPTIEIAGFPKPISSATEVPLWAYMDVTELGNITFSPQLAQINATSPPPTSTSGSTPSSVLSSTTIVPLPTNTNSTGKSHAGAIAGGVVGGLAAIVITGLAAFWAYSHRHRSIGRPTPVYGGADLAGAGAPLSPQTINAPIFPDVPSHSTQPVHHHNMSESSLSPVSPMTSGIYTTFGTHASFDTLPQSPHGFRGAAEV